MALYKPSLVSGQLERQIWNHTEQRVRNLVIEMRLEGSHFRGLPARYDLKKNIQPRGHDILPYIGLEDRGSVDGAHGDGPGAA